MLAPDDGVALFFFQPGEEVTDRARKKRKGRRIWRRRLRRLSQRGYITRRDALLEFIPNRVSFGRPCPRLDSLDFTLDQVLDFRRVWNILHGHKAAEGLNPKVPTAKKVGQNTIPRKLNLGHGRQRRLFALGSNKGNLIDMHQPFIRYDVIIVSPVENEVKGKAQQSKTGQYAKHNSHYRRRAYNPH